MNTEQNVSKISEEIVIGRRFRQLIDKETNTWGRICGWYVTDRPFVKATPIDSNKTQKEK